MARVLATGTMPGKLAGVAGRGRALPNKSRGDSACTRDGRIEEAWEIADVAALERLITDADHADTE
jgi:hypothetical protein